jgi:hypothetical protein
MVIQTVKTTILWRACQADRVLESANGAAMKSCAEPIQKKSWREGSGEEGQEGGGGRRI